MVRDESAALMTENSSRCVSCLDEEYTEDIPRLVGYGNVEAGINSIKS